MRLWNPFFFFWLGYVTFEKKKTDLQAVFHKECLEGFGKQGHISDICSIFVKSIFHAYDQISVHWYIRFRIIKKVWKIFINFM